jgi:streptomycin 6-kinase
MAGRGAGGELVVPAKLAATVVAWEGDDGQRWLERLPVLVREVAAAWNLQLSSPFEPGGNISWVAPARRQSDGLEVVLKVQLPHPESEPEAAGLRAWAGDGAVRLFDHDPDRRALLLERCRPGTALADEGGAPHAVRAGAMLGARLHAAPAPVGLPTLANVLDSWANELASRLDDAPLGDAGLGRVALDTMRTRPRACTSPVLLHGDLNPTNVLSAEREPWLAIDAKPMLGDAAYDGPRLILQPDPLAQPNPAATLLERIAIVSDAMGVDRDALIAWCLVGAVEMGTWARSHGDKETADSCAAHTTLIAPHLP